MRPAHKMPLLEELAGILRLSSIRDLLEPRNFTSSEHEWLQAHNNMINGSDGQLEKAMASKARAVAIKLGCKGIRHGEHVKKPTTLLATVHAVLTQQCAMLPPELKINAARSVMDKSSPCRRWHQATRRKGCSGTRGYA